MAWLTVLVVAYFLRGAGRVYSDFTAHPGDQPSYAAEGQVGMALLAAFFWWRRKSIADTTFSLLWIFLFVAGIYWGLGFLIASAPLRLTAIAALPMLLFAAAIAARRPSPRP